MTTFAEYPITDEELASKLTTEGVTEHEYGNIKYKRLKVKYEGDKFVFIPNNPLKTFGVNKYDDEAGGKPSYSISFELEPEEDRELEQYLKDVHSNMCKIAFENKEDLGMKWKKLEYAEDAIKPILSVKEDKKGTIRKRFYAKLRDIPAKGERVHKMLTAFEDSEGVELKWDELIGIRSKMVPAIVFEGFYCGGGKCSIQTKVEHVIVTETMGYEKVDYMKALRGSATLMRK